ncbi:protein EMBRYONIC FLOWER 1 [Morus notabilis]|uniref:protein EMBRYONIC FLOWER 1 n=1 Tax=Morus notabilis TaxID=981085 RepID=UPI000CED1F52|nr:protein EMBRYONIC FLOWER 1 [Morus notabilis]XP_024023848.1 protein EMBRYONIC FLOWER 1 [Morus notabilis]
MKGGTIMMNNKKGDSDTVSKNVGSFVKIDSISIDLEDVNNKGYVEKCEHFSIRGYVSEVRRKNWKLCWPFTLGDEQNKSEEQKTLLPPLDAPKFRWWSCQSCLQEMSSRGTAKDNVAGFNSCIGSKSSSTCSQIPSLCDSVMPFPDDQQTPKPNEVEKRKSDVYTSTDANRNIHQLSSCSDKKEVLVSEAHTTIIGHGNGSENDAVHEIPILTFVPPEIDSNVSKEKPKQCTEALKLAGSKPMDPYKNCCGKHELTDVQPAANMGMCKSCSKICQTEKQKSVDEQEKELKVASGASALACLNEEAGKAVKGQTNGYASRVLDECDYASSKSVKILAGDSLQDYASSKSVKILAGDSLQDYASSKSVKILAGDSLQDYASSKSVKILAGDSLQDQNHPLSSGSQRRKTRKVRLLTELLFDNGDAKTDRISAENSPPNATINDASAGAGAVNVPKDQLSLPENRGEDLGDDKKRKLPQDEEGRSPEMSSLNNRSKKSNNLKGNEEAVNAVAISELEQEASAGLYLQNGTKNCVSKFGNDNIPSTGKKKRKKNQTIDAPSSLAPTRGSLPKQILDRVAAQTKGYLDDGIFFKFYQEACARGELEKISLAASRKEKKLSLFKKKSKMAHIDDGQTPQFPWNSGFHEKHTTMRNEEIMQTGPLPVSFPATEDASIDTGLHLSLGSCFTTNKYNANEIPRTNVDANYISDSSIPSKSASYAFFKKRVHGEFSRNLDANNVPVLSGEQNYNSQVEESCYPLVKQVDISGASNCEKAILVKDHSSVSRKHADRIAANVSDSGAWDDIPMEIVELMARNQYERRLENAENNNRLLKTANEGRINQTIDYDRVCGSGELRIIEETGQRRNPRARNGINSSRKNVQSGKQKSVDYISNVNADNFNINHLGQKKSSSGVQYPVSSSQCSCAQNCKLNQDMAGHGFLNASMQLGPCEKCPIVSRPREEAAHLWSSTIPLHMPTSYNVSQKVASQPTNFNFLRKHDPGFLNLNVGGLEKHNQNSGSETFSRRNAEYPFANKHNGLEPQQNLMGSLDLYSNETIPAMHLLSLMDAGMQSGPAFNTGGNSKFLKRTCPLDHNSKEYSQLEFGVYSRPGDIMKNPLGVYSKPSDTTKYPLDYYGKNKLPEKSHDFFPLNPTGGPSSSSFHHDKGFGRPNDFMGQVSFSSRRKEKVQSSSLPAQNRGHKALNPMFASGGLATNHNAIPGHGLQKGLLGASSSMMCPLQLHTTENSTELKLGTPHNNGTFWPPKISPESSICSINRNPADFSMPEAGNEYMIRGEDLKFGKLRKRPGLLSVDQRKRQRNAKRTTEKANVKN